MKVFLYLVGVFVSLLIGIAIGWFSGSFAFGVVVSMGAFFVATYLMWERMEFGGGAGDLRGDDEESRVHARNAGAYSQSGHGGHGGADGGGGLL